MGKKVKTNKVHQIRDSKLRQLEKKWTDNATSLALISFLTVLHDKEGYGRRRLSRVFRDVNKLSEEVNEGRVSLLDLKKVLEEEQGIVVVLKEIDYG